MASLIVNAVEQIRASAGAYQFRLDFKGPLAQNQSALVEFGTTFGPDVNRALSIDVSATLRGKANWNGTLSSFALLGDILSVFNRGQFYEKKINARGVIWTGPGKNTISDKKVQFDSPVKPVSEASRRLADQEFKLNYTGNPNGTGGGSLIFNVPSKSEIAANYYFVSAGYFVTSPAKRGFDCTTFLMAAFGLFSDVSTESGEVVAQKKGMTRRLSKVWRQYLVSEIETKYNGKEAIILIHKGNTETTHHCVMVKDGFVYEFNKPSASQIGLTPSSSNGGFITKLGNWREKDNSFYSLYI